MTTANEERQDYKLLIRYIRKQCTSASLSSKKMCIGERTLPINNQRKEEIFQEFYPKKIPVIIRQLVYKSLQDMAFESGVFAFCIFGNHSVPNIDQKYIYTSPLAIYFFLLVGSETKKNHLAHLVSIKRQMVQ